MRINESFVRNLYRCAVLKLFYILSDGADAAGN